MRTDPRKGCANETELWLWAANGLCHWCDEPVATGLRYCDADCRDDHARAQRAKGVAQ